MEWNVIALLIALSLVCCDKPKTITLNSNCSIQDKLLLHETNKFYIITVPSSGDHPEDEQLNLFIKLTPIEGVMSKYVPNPDLFVSRTNEYPINEENSDFYSTSIGEDFVTITDVKPGEIYYIGVFCRGNCFYELENMVSIHYEIEANSKLKVKVLKNVPSFFVFRQTKLNYDRLEFTAYTLKVSEEFEFLIRQHEMPTPEEHLPIIPGYVNTVQIKGNNASSCNNCKYYILIQSLGSDIEVILQVKYSNSIIPITSATPIMGSLSKFSRSCYQFDISYQSRNDTITIESMLYTGNVEVMVNAETLPAFSNQFLVSEQVHSFRNINIKVDELSSKFREEEAENENSEKSVTTYICVKAIQDSSYILRVFFHDQISNMEDYNFLPQDVPIPVFIASNCITRFNVNDFDSDADINFSINTTNGSVDSFAYFCTEIVCQITQEFLTDHKDDLVPAISISNSSKHININSVSNSCKVNQECYIIVILKCTSSIECSIKISMHESNKAILLSPRGSHAKHVYQGKFDFYKIEISDSSISRLIIIANEFSGDIDLYAVQVSEISDHKDSIKSEDYESLKSKIIENNLNNNPLQDIITFDKAPINGVYLIAVYGRTYSTYQIRYYMNDNSNDDAESHLSLDNPTKDYIYEAASKKYLVMIPKRTESEGIRISLSPEKGEYKVIATIGDSAWESNHYNEILIGSNEIPNEVFNLIIEVTLITMTDFNSNMEWDYYINCSLSNGVIHVPDSVSHDLTLKNEFWSQSYVHNIVKYDSKKLISLNVLEGKINLFGTFSLTKFTKGNFDEFEIKLLNTKSTHIHAEPICEADQSCSLYLVLQAAVKEVRSNCIITIKDSERLNIKLKESLAEEGIIVIEEKRYFYSFVSDITSPGRIALNSKGANSVLYGKLMTFNDFSEKYKKQLKESDYPNLSNCTFYNTDESDYKSIDLNFSNIKQCGGNCVILITIKCSSYLSSQTLIDSHSQFCNYNILLSSSSQRISVNSIVGLYLTKETIHYFKFEIEKNAKRLTVTVNSDSSIDLYMNEGFDPPSKSKSTYKSESGEHLQVIELDDSQVKESLYYIIGVYSYLQAKASIYISTSENEILPLMDSFSSSCIIEEKDEFCFFSYTDFKELGDDKDQQNKFKIEKGDQVEFIFLMEIVYGQATMCISENFRPTELEVTSNPEVLYESSNTCDDAIIKARYYIDDSILESPNPSILISVKGKSKKTLLRLRSTKLIVISLQNQNLSTFDKSSIEMYEQKTGAIQPGASLIYSFSTTIDEILMLLKIYQGEGTVEISKTVDFSSLIIYTGSVSELNSFSSEIVETKKLYSIMVRLFIRVTNTQPQGSGKILIYNIQFSNSLYWHSLEPGTEMKINIPHDSYYKGFIALTNVYDSLLFNIIEESLVETLVVYIKYNVAQPTDFNEIDKFLSVPNERDYDDKLQLSKSIKTGQITLLGLIATEAEFSSKRYFIVFNIYNASRDLLTNTTINVIPKVKGFSSASIKPIKLNTGTIQVPSSYGFGSHTMIYSIDRIDGKTIYEFEFSTCVGEIEVIIADSNDFYNIDFKDHILFQKLVSMKNLITRVDSQKSLYVYLNGIQGETKRVCRQEANQADCYKGEKWVDYSVSYAILNSDELNEESVEDEGLIRVSDSGIGNSLSLSWKPIRYFNKSKFSYETATNVKYYIYIADNEFFYPKMQSTCFLITLNPSFTIEPNTKIKEFSKIINKSHKKTVYINILAYNTSTGESYAYIPTKIFITYSSHVMFVFLSLIITIIVLGVAFFFYRKFKQVRKSLSHEIRNNNILFKLHESTESSTADRSNEMQLYTQEVSIQNAKNVQYLELDSQI